jgi:ribosome-associated translation inhibitor RaiA
MLVQLKTDSHVVGSAEMTTWVETEVTSALDRHAAQITRVDVYLADLNSHKTGGDDKQCKVEARLAGLDPIVVTDNAGSVDAALNGALEKLLATLDRRLDKLRDHKGRTSFGGDQTI